jgi:hypothetical protein
VLYSSETAPKTVVANTILSAIKNMIGGDELRDPTIIKYIANPDRSDDILFRVIEESRINILPMDGNNQAIPGLEGILQWFVFGLRDVLSKKQIIAEEGDAIRFTLDQHSAKTIAEKVGENKIGFSVPPDRFIVATMMEKYELVRIDGKDGQGNLILEITQDSWFPEFFVKKSQAKPLSRDNEDAVASEQSPQTQANSDAGQEEQQEQQPVSTEKSISAEELIAAIRKLWRINKGVKKTQEGLEVEMSGLSDYFGVSDSEIEYWLKAHGIVSDEIKGAIKSKHMRKYVHLPMGVLERFPVA